MNEPCAEQWLTKHLIGEGYFITVANLDLQMGGGGGGGHPDSEIRGARLNNKGRARAPPLDPPLYYIAASP